MSNGKVSFEDNIYDVMEVLGGVCVMPFAAKMEGAGLLVIVWCGDKSRFWKPPFIGIFSFIERIQISVEEETHVTIHKRLRF